MLLLITLLLTTTIYRCNGEFQSLKNYVVVLQSPGYRTLSRTRASLGSETERLKFKSESKLKIKRILGNTNTRKFIVNEYLELACSFSVRLNSREALDLNDDPEVLFVQEDTKVELFTTRSFDFLGLSSLKHGIWRKTTGTDVILGIIDTGIWPESASFSDDGFGPIPSKFKGRCDAGSDPTFKCNKKLIGARFFGSTFVSSNGKPLAQLTASCGDSASPRDVVGHGTHVAGTAAGTAVPYATTGGEGRGINMGSPRGAALSARLAVYKVFWCGGGAFLSDVISAMDTAVADGVDILSLSLGGAPDGPRFDGNALYHFSYLAAAAGVSVSFAAGNGGPSWFTVTNAVPWVLTVAASSTDRCRRYASKIVLGDGTQLLGENALNVGGTPGFLLRSFRPLVHASAAFLNPPSKLSRPLAALNRSVVEGNIVLCLRGTLQLDTFVKLVVSFGGVGVVLYGEKNNTWGLGRTLTPALTPKNFPILSLSSYEGALLLNYVSGAKEPKAYMLNVPVFGKTVAEAPEIAPFSSAGPNGGSLSILKPDIAAPGMDIFAASSEHKGGPPWAFKSGTSMATPHASGTLALLRALHPNWTPSMYFSAMMTTASQITNWKKPIKATPFSKGSGNINPNAAADPGLVYPISSNDYSVFFCSADSVKKSLCTLNKTTRAIDLNLPSVAFSAAPVHARTSTVRTMMNVGREGVYFASVLSPPGSLLTVVPRKLRFSRKQKHKYTISVLPKMGSAFVRGALATVMSPRKGTKRYNLSWTFGSITWADNRGHSVRINVALNSL